MKFVKIFLVIFLITIVLGFSVFYGMPHLRPYLLHEDSLVENLSAGFYLISFFTGLFFLFRRGAQRMALSIISAVSLLAFLDEISFGGSTLEFNISYIHINIDAIHDLFQLVYVVFQKLINDYTTYFILLIIGGIVLVIALLLKYGSKLSAIITNNYYKPPYILASFFVILNMCSLLIDLDIIQSGALQMTEELFEMDGGLALFFCALSLQKQDSY